MLYLKLKYINLSIKIWLSRFLRHIMLFEIIDFYVFDLDFTFFEKKLILNEWFQSENLKELIKVIMGNKIFDV